MIGHGDGPGGSGPDLSEDDFFKYIGIRKTRGRRRIGKETLKKLIPSAIMAIMNLIGMRKESNKVSTPKFFESPVMRTFLKYVSRHDTFPFAFNKQRN